MHPALRPPVVTPFRLERYFAEHEFSARYLLCCSDCEALSVSDLLALGDEESRQLWNDLRLGYTESRGHPVLRQEIARRYSDVVKPEHVLCCVPVEGILLFAATLLRPGDRVVVTAPAYQSLHSLADMFGCQVTFWYPRRTGDGWEFNTEDLRSVAAGGVECIIMNSPHNPTGCCLSPEDVQSVIDIAKEHNAYLFSDEVYRESGPSAVEYGYERTIALGALSKTHSLPGLRVGWVVTLDQQLLAQLVDAKDYTTICGSAPSEVLGIIALRATDAILARNRAIIKTNVEAATLFFAKWKHFFRWAPPQGGTTSWLELINGETADDFSARVLRGCGILLLPGAQFGSSCPPGQFMRIGLGRKDFPDLLRILDEFLT